VEKKNSQQCSFKKGRGSGSIITAHVKPNLTGPLQSGRRRPASDGGPGFGDFLGRDHIPVSS
jgi:hypothetical protein